MKKIAALALSAMLVACTAAQVSAWQTALASPQAQSLVAGVLNFDPAIQKIVAKVNGGLAATTADKQMVCGAVSWANGLFTLAAVPAGIPAQAQASEAAAMAGVENLCNADTSNLNSAVGNILSFYVTTATALQNAKVLPKPATQGA